MRFIKDFVEDEKVVGHYLCKQKLNGKSKSGKTYLTLKLVDKTAMIDAKIWELNNNIQSFAEGDFIKIDADVNLYQNELQLKVNKVRKSLEGEFDPRDYMPCTDKDVNQLYTELTGYIKSLSNPFLKQLLEMILITDEKIKSAFLSHSAAKNMHHSYIGGLVEHTLSVVQICDFFSSHYTYVNRDVLLTGAMLHDIAKVFELSEFPDNDYTDSGQLIGHIVMGSELVLTTAAKINGFPEDLKRIIQHMILSHHGEFEFGSPKLPHLIEAVLLHAADNLDAKTKAFEEALTANDLNGNWLGFNKIFQRNIRNTEFSDK